jgi:hypothetical protein
MNLCHNEAHDPRTIAVSLDVEGNESILHSFLLTISRIPGLIQSSVRRFFDAKEVH